MPSPRHHFAWGSSHPISTTLPEALPAHTIRLHGDHGRVMTGCLRRTQIAALLPVMVQLSKLTVSVLLALVS